MTGRRPAAILAVLIASGGLVFYVGSGAYDMGADSPHWEITRKAIQAVRDRSIAARAGDIDLPELQDEQLVSKGTGATQRQVRPCPLCRGSIFIALAAPRTALAA